MKAESNCLGSSNARNRKSTASLRTLFPAGGYTLYGFSKMFAPLGISAAFYATTKENKKKKY
ncbi:MAG: hypothetical protein ACLRQF_02210 [Thomasclavelia ramosa]